MTTEADASDLVPLSRPLPDPLRYGVAPRVLPPASLVVQPLAEPPPSLTVRRSPRRMKIGALLLGIGYAPAVALALALSPQAGEPGGPSLGANYTLFIPGVGPIVSGIYAPATSPPGTAGRVLTSWTLPLVLTLGLLQATGTALLIDGAVPALRPTGPAADSLDLHFPPWRTD